MPKPIQKSSKLSKEALPERLEQLKEAYPRAKVELWATDEHRLGLKPIIRKVWSPKGERPLVKVHQRYEWTYLYAFVRPSTGEVHWLILPTVNVEVFSLALSNFAREVVGLGKDKRILLVVDKAGWHTGKEVNVPEGIHLEFLPPSSPELQPAERLWPLANEAVANRLFEEIEDLEESLVGRCVALCGQPELIRSYTHYHWWPEAA
jgi:transposase